MIQVSHLSRSFGRHAVLSDVTFRVAPNEGVALTGPNGAGKTTLLRILACCLPASSGTATVNGYDIFSESIDARASLGYSPEHSPLYAELTVWEQLRFHGRIRGMSGPPLYHAIMDLTGQIGLADVRHARISSLSRGTRARVAVAAALLASPPVVLLDEPYASIDEPSKRAIHDILAAYRREHSLLIVTHHPEEFDGVCSRVLRLENGVISGPDATDADCAGGADS